MNNAQFASLAAAHRSFAQSTKQRVHAMQGTVDQAAAYYEKARVAGHAIQAAEDRTIFEADLATDPWCGWRAN